jgi:CRP-like cAMP-binding protein
VRINQEDGAMPNFGYVRDATIDDLKCCELFEKVEDDALNAIVTDSIIYKLDAHKRLQPTRAQVDYIYVILSGYVAVWVTSQFTEMEETFLAWRGPGQIIGEMRLVIDDASNARIITCEPCEFIEIRRDTLTDVANYSAQIYRNIARLLVKKMEHERCRSEIVRMSPSSRQVAQILLHLAHERCGSESLKKFNEVEIPGIIHQDEIGGYVGIERETINRKLCELKKNGIISYVKSKKGSAITILNREALERVARRDAKNSS